MLGNMDPVHYMDHHYEDSVGNRVKNITVWWEGQFMEAGIGMNDGASHPTPSICLVMKRFGGAERSFALSRPFTRIGRDMRCELQVLLPGISPEHCAIERREGRLILRDLSSETGTMHNNRSVSEAELREGDTIAVGPVKFTVRSMPLGEPLANERSRARRQAFERDLRDSGHAEPMPSHLPEHGALDDYDFGH